MDIRSTKNAAVRGTAVRAAPRPASLGRAARRSGMAKVCETFVEDYLAPFQDFVAWLKATDCVPVDAKLARLGAAERELRRNAANLSAGLDGRDPQTALAIREAMEKVGAVQGSLQCMQKQYSDELVEQEERRRCGAVANVRGGVGQRAGATVGRAGAEGGGAARAGDEDRSAEGRSDAERPTIRFRLNNYIVDPQSLGLRRLDYSNAGLASDSCFCTMFEHIEKDVRTTRIIVPDDVLADCNVKDMPKPTRRSAARSSLWIFANAAR